MTPSGDLARAVLCALRTAGVQHVVLCPGSRSAPLAYALQEGEHTPGAPRLHVRHDERVAGFTALGMASGGTPSAVVTTSGTAVANLHPAVLEAHHGGLPLLLLTADRPRALRGTWANQTSDLQVQIFGQAVRARLDLEATEGPPVADRQRELNRCLAAATGAEAGRPGPVHVNLGFTEPLVPDDGPPSGNTWGDEEGRPASSRGESAPRDARPLRLAAGPRTVIVAGARTAAGGRADGASARRLAESTGWPLLAEPTSGARHGDSVIGPYRLLLEQETLATPIERVVVFGRPTLSRPVTKLLSRGDVEMVLVSPWKDWPEPGRPATRVTSVEPDAPMRPTGERGWFDFSQRWHSAGRRAQVAVDAVLDRWEEPCGPLVARAVARSLRSGDVLVAASSNPIRDIDLAAGALTDGSIVLANRGLSGIDGTIATATGCALATGTRVRALVGDLAFLHDAGALLSGPTEQRAELQVVVLNDGGGGIFSLLEYGERAGRGPLEAVQFERIFGTPHGADLGALCRGYDVAHRRVRTEDELRVALGSPQEGTSVVEVRVDRAGLRGLHAALRAEVAALLSSG